MTALSLAKHNFFFHRSLLQNLFLLFEFVGNNFGWTHGRRVALPEVLPALVAICHTLSVFSAVLREILRLFFYSPIDEIQQEMKEQKDVERHMKNMSNDLVKLNMLINKNKNSVVELQNGKIVTENEFLQSLKVLRRLAPHSQSSASRAHQRQKS